MRCLFSELIPSLLVAMFNIAIIACILRTTAHVRRHQKCHLNKHTSISVPSGSITKNPPSSPMQLYDRSQQLQVQTSLRQTSMPSSSYSSSSVPLGKMSWMNIVLLLHSLLFFFSSSITSLVFFSTYDLRLAHWVSVIILANCSLNFYIYCLSGRQFRRELKRIARQYIRHLHKLFIRKRYSKKCRQSPTPNGKNVIYQPIHQMKPRNCLTAPCIRSYPAHQITKCLE